MSPSYLCQVEVGTRRPSQYLAERLETVCGTRAGFFTSKYRFPGRGRRAASVQTGEALRRLTRAVPVVEQMFQPPLRVPEPPPYRWDDWRGTVDNPLFPIGVHLRSDAQAEVEQLEARRSDNDDFWQLVNGVPFDSWTERRFLVKLGLAGGEMVRIAPARLEAAAAVVCPRTGRDTRHRPQVAMIVQHGELSAAFWPQRPVRGRSFWKLDALVVAAVAGVKVTVNLEIDGNHEHHRRRDDARWDDLQLPTLR